MRYCVGRTAKKQVLALISAAVLLGGCAKSADNVRASYVSPARYSASTCDDLAFEAEQVSRELAIVADDQDSARTRDAIAVGVGAVVFWPALLFLAAGDDENELAELKGRYEAIEEASYRKNCPHAARMAAERREAEREIAHARETDRAKAAKRAGAPD